MVGHFRRGFSAQLVIATAISACASDDTPPDSPGDVLTLAGWTSLGEATVSVELDGDRTEVVAQPDGRYELALALNRLDEVIILRAEGASARAQDFAVLASVLDTGEVIEAAAGSDAVLDRSEHGGVVISTLSTARYAGLFAANNGRPPANRQELLAADFASNTELDGTTLVHGAAALDLIIESDDYALEPGFETTLNLVERIAAFRNVAAEPAKPSLDIPLQNAARALLDRPDPFVPVEASRLSEHWSELVQNGNGYVGSIGSRWRFNGGGQGLYQRPPLGRFEPPQDFSWSVEAGRLVVEFDEPLTSTELLSTEDLASLTADPVLKSEIRQVLGPDGAVDVERELTTWTFQRIPGGIRVDRLATQRRFVYRIDNALAPLGIVAGPAEYLAAGGSTWFRPEELVFEPLDEDELLGVWAMQVFAPAHLAELFGTIQQGDPIFSHAQVTFAPDGVALAEGGVLATPLTLSWTLLADGRVALDYPSGARQLLAILDRARSEVGMVHWLEVDGDSYIDYWRARKIDPGASFSMVTLLNEPDEYWQTTVNLALYFTEPDGRLPNEALFGFRFLPGGVATQLFNPPTFTEGWNYELFPSEIRIERRFDSTGAFGCLMSDPSCVVQRRRVWKPVGQADGLLFVLEELTYAAAWPSFQDGAVTWDSVERRYEDPLGNTVDVEEQRSFIYPRLNAYYLSKVPSR